MDGEERKGDERKEKEQFGTEFVVVKLSKIINKKHYKDYAS